MAFVTIFSQIKLLFGKPVIQLVWYMLKQLSTSVSVKVMDIYLAASRLGEYPPLFTSTSVSNRPFAGSRHMVQNKLHWDANDAVGLSKQRKVGLDW